MPAMLSWQKVESYGPWQLLLPVKQLTPLFVHVPHHGEVSATAYAASCSGMLGKIEALRSLGLVGAP